MSPYSLQGNNSQCIFSFDIETGPIHQAECKTMPARAPATIHGCRWGCGCCARRAARRNKLYRIRKVRDSLRDMRPGSSSLWVLQYWPWPGEFSRRVNKKLEVAWTQARHPAWKESRPGRPTALRCRASMQVVVRHARRSHYYRILRAHTINIKITRFMFVSASYVVNGRQCLHCGKGGNGKSLRNGVCSMALYCGAGTLACYDLHTVDATGMLDSGILFEWGL